jgi:hypothetical protein
MLKLSNGFYGPYPIQNFEDSFVEYNFTFAQLYKVLGISFRALSVSIA